MDEIILMINFRNSLVAGETLDAKVCHATATDITAVFVGPGKHTLNFTQAGEEWTITQATADWSPGLYRWQLWVESPAGKSVCGTGRMKVEASLADLPEGTDNRTTAEKNIEAIETMLGGKASSAVKRYRINNRELENYSITELLALLTYWKGVRRRQLPRRPGRNLRVFL